MTPLNSSNTFIYQKERISSLLPDNLSSQVDFPIGTDSKIQVFNLSDIKISDSTEMLRIKSQNSLMTDSGMKMKSANKFRIAFGTKIIENQNKSNKPKSNIDSQSNDIRKNSLTEESSNSLSLSTKKLQTQEQDSNPSVSVVKQKSSRNAKPDAESEGNPIKIPHPPVPPASARRPAIISARKAQLSSKDLRAKHTTEAVDKNTGNYQDQDDQTNTLNESITDIIQTLKLSEKSNNEKSLNDSNNMYSFSSKPIVVDVDNRKAKYQSESKVYDFRKYISNSPQKKMVDVDGSSRHDDVLESNYAKDHGDQNNDSIEPVDVQVNNAVISVMDSFEAKMLMDMKAEMDKEANKVELQSQKQPKPEFVSSAYSPLIFESKPKSKHNQSESNSNEKYNYENLTNSYDTDTTTSISKKLFIKKLNEPNVYQDEMNVSLAANIARSSVTIQNYQVVSANKRKENPITEEIHRYDDSQATDDVTDNSEDEIDLMYDSALNCYYDPKTCTYYELNMT